MALLLQIMADVHINELMTDEDFIQTIEEMHINEDSELGDLLSEYDASCLQQLGGAKQTQDT